MSNDDNRRTHVYVADRGEFDTRITLGCHREKKIKILKDLGYEVTPTDYGDPYIISWK